MRLHVPLSKIQIFLIFVTVTSTIVWGVKHFRYFTGEHPVHLHVHISNTPLILPLLSTLLPSVQSGTNRNSTTDPLCFFLTSIYIRSSRPSLLTLPFLRYNIHVSVKPITTTSMSLLPIQRQVSFPLDSSFEQVPFTCSHYWYKRYILFSTSLSNLHPLQPPPIFRVRYRPPSSQTYHFHHFFPSHR